LGVHFNSKETFMSASRDDAIVFAHNNQGRFLDELKEFVLSFSSE